MAVQIDYVNLPAAFEGMIANTEPSVLISRTVETAAMGFGKVARQGVGDNGIRAATAADHVVRGITVRDMSTDPENPNQYGVGESALVMTAGVVWVTAGESVVAGDLVWMKVGGETAGRFVKTATDNLPIPGAMFDSSGANGALVRVRIGANVTGPEGPPGQDLT
jgi:hypothetical protein